MNVRALLLTVAITLLVGCSSLSVRVDVASPAAVQEWNGQRLIGSALPLAKSEAHVNALGQRIDALRATKLDQFIASHESDFANLNHDARQQVIDDLRKRFDATVGAFYEYHKLVLSELLVNISKTSKDLAACEEKIKEPDVSLQGSARRLDEEKILASEAKCGRYKGALIPLLRQREAVLADAERGPDFVAPESSAPLTSLIGQDGLFREPEAAAIAAAPEALWHKRFDQSFSWSIFGDTNVAIKMESRGNFSIKGVSFDPSEITRIASKVVTQSLLAWTQIAGVPSSAAASQPGSVSRIIDQNDQERTSLDADRSDQWRALLVVADSVAGTNSRLTTGDAGQKAAIDSLVAVWEANKERVLHQEKAPVPSTMTLTPVTAQVAPGRPVTLYAALTSNASNDATVALTSDESSVFDLPKFVIIAKGDLQAQTTITPKADSPWKKYTVNAAREPEPPRQVTVYVAPDFDVSAVPRTILVGQSTESKAVASAPRPESSSVDYFPKVVAAPGDLQVIDSNFAGTNLTFKMKADKEGSGSFTINTGDARTQPVSVTLVKPTFKLSSAEVAAGASKIVSIAIDRHGASGQVEGTVLTFSQLGIKNDTKLTWDDDKDQTITIQGVTVGAQKLTMQTASGNVVFDVTVATSSAKAEPAVAQGVVDSTIDIKLSDDDFIEAKDVTISVDSADVVSSDKASVSLKKGAPQTITLTLKKPGNAKVLVKSGEATLLTVPVTVGSKP
jgi:hypothetical protein